MEQNHVSSTSTSISKIIIEQFNKNSEVTLNDLYEILSNDSNMGLSRAALKHRVRSIINSLRKRNKVKRVAPCTYTKI